MGGLIIITKNIERSLREVLEESVTLEAPNNFLHSYTQRVPVPRNFLIATSALF